MLHRYLCETCGGNLTKVDDAHYTCDWCHNVYTTEKIENYATKKYEMTKKKQNLKQFWAYLFLPFLPHA